MLNTLLFLAGDEVNVSSLSATASSVNDLSGAVQNVEAVSAELEPGVVEQAQAALRELLASDIGDGKAAIDRWVTVRMRVTAYCPCAKCCGRFADGRTACNHRVNWGDRFVAADKVFPFGTEMIIPGYNHSKPVKVLDRGRDIKGYRLDVFYNTHYTASKWGTKYLDVKVRIADR